MSNEINNIQNELEQLLNNNNQNNKAIKLIQEQQQKKDKDLNIKLVEVKNKIKELDSLLNNTKTTYNNLISDIDKYNFNLDDNIITISQNQQDLNSQIRSLQENISNNYTQETIDGVFIDFNTFSKIINYLSFFAAHNEVDPKFVDSLIATAKKQEQKQLMIKDQNDKLTVKKDEPKSITRPLDINDLINYIAQQINNEQK